MQPELKKNLSAPPKLSKKASAKSKTPAADPPKNLGMRPAAATPEEEKVPEAEANKRAKRTPLWDTKQLTVGNWLSQVSYLQIKSIESDEIIVSTSTGDEWEVDKSCMDLM